MSAHPLLLPAFEVFNEYARLLPSAHYDSKQPFREHTVNSLPATTHRDKHIVFIMTLNVRLLHILLNARLSLISEGFPYIVNKD